MCKETKSILLINELFGTTISTNLCKVYCFEKLSTTDDGSDTFEHEFLFGFNRRMLWPLFELPSSWSQVTKILLRNLSVFCGLGRTPNKFGNNEL